MNDYRVTLKVRNNRLLKAIEAAGGSPGAKWCEENGLLYNAVNDLINMTASPINANGSLRKPAAVLCDVLEKLPEELWSNEQLYPLEKNFSEVEMSYSQLCALLPGADTEYLEDSSEFEEDQKKALINTALATLTAREQRVITMRFLEDATYQEIGKKVGVTKGRIRQIEDKALRKLRKPSRKGLLVELVDLSDEETQKYKDATLEEFKKAGDEFRSNLPDLRAKASTSAR